VLRKKNENENEINKHYWDVDWVIGREINVQFGQILYGCLDGVLCTVMLASDL
jgi:hypothetical protein